MSFTEEEFVVIRENKKSQMLANADELELVEFPIQIIELIDANRLKSSIK